jgi:hypothetical protein
MHQKLIKSTGQVWGGAVGEMAFGCGLWAPPSGGVGHPPVAGRGLVKTSQASGAYMRCAEGRSGSAPWAKVVLLRPPERKTRARNSFPADIGNLEPRHFIQTWPLQRRPRAPRQGCVVCKTGPKRKGSDVFYDLSSGVGALVMLFTWLEPLTCDGFLIDWGDHAWFDNSITFGTFAYYLAATLGSNPVTYL